MSAKSLGPFDTEEQARAAAQAAADPGLVLIKAAEDRRLLRRVCDAAGVIMGRYDDKIVTWLAIWDPSTVVVVAGWITRAYESGRVAGEGPRP